MPLDSGGGGRPQRSINLLGSMLEPCSYVRSAGTQPLNLACCPAFACCRQGKPAPAEGGDVVGLFVLITRKHGQAEETMKRPLRVASCFEAGYDGFWLHRWLCAHGVETPSSKTNRSSSSKCAGAAPSMIALRNDRGRSLPSAADGPAGKSNVPDSGGKRLEGRAVRQIDEIIFAFAVGTALAS
jgi:hypothetical protein